MQSVALAAATANKTCAVCKVEKPISAFHRRGNGFQNICKECRLEAAKLPHSPRVKKDNSQNFPTIAERIQKLEPRLRMIARQHANDPMEADDVYSYICEKILRHAKAEDTDSYYLKAARLRARDYVKKEIAYSMRVGGEEEIAGNWQEEEPGDVWEAFYIESEVKTPEEIAAEKDDREAVMNAIAALDPKHRQIVVMLANGLTQAEIARELDVTRAMISIRVGEIRQRLAGLYASI